MVVAPATVWLLAASKYKQLPDTHPLVLHVGPFTRDSVCVPRSSLTDEPEPSLKFQMDSAEFQGA